MKVRSLFVVGLLSFAFAGCGPQEQEGPPEPEEVVGSDAQMLIGAPSRLITIPGPDQVLLWWPAVTGAASYKIFSGTSSSNLPQIGTSDTNYAFVSADSTMRYYAVRSVTSTEESVNSPVATATGWTNQALNKQAAQSTSDPQNGGPANAAVDGNTDSVSATSTVNGGQPQWWRVDLGYDKSIYEMHLWNRPDCCQGELSQVSIYKSTDSSNIPVNWGQPIAVQQDPAGRPSTIDLSGVTARHVMLRRDGVPDGMLSMGEVQIFGTVRDTTLPSHPFALTATAVAGPRVDLKWGSASDNVGVKRYFLERSTCTGETCTSFVNIAIMTPTVYTYSDPRLVAGKTYRYRMRAQDYAGNLSLWSAYTSATTF